MLPACPSSIPTSYVPDGAGGNSRRRRPSRGLPCRKSQQRSSRSSTTTTKRLRPLMKESARRMRPSSEMPQFLNTRCRPLIEREKEHPAPSLRGRGEQTSRSRLLSRTRSRLLLLRTRPVAVVANIAVVPDRRRSFAPNLLALEHTHEATRRQRELTASLGRCACVCERELLSNFFLCPNWLGGSIDRL